MCVTFALASGAGNGPTCKTRFLNGDSGFFSKFTLLFSNCMYANIGDFFTFYISLTLFYLRPYLLEVVLYRVIAFLQ